MISPYVSPGLVRHITLTDVLEAVAASEGVTVKEIVGKRKFRRVIIARQRATYLAKRLLPQLTDVKLGPALGYKDHTTIGYNVQQVRNDFDIHPEEEEKVERIIKQLNPFA